jgi:murein DD-endopeptidase MepM/ murein hydrolase activator NlpD
MIGTMRSSRCHTGNIKHGSVHQQQQAGPDAVGAVTDVRTDLGGVRSLTVVRRLLVAVLVLGLLPPLVGLAVPSTASMAQERSSDEVQRELEATARERDGLAGELGQVQGALDQAEEELAAVGARLEDARSRLTAAEGQVALAEMALADAEQERDRAERAHERSLVLLAAAEEELAEQEQLLSEQLVHTFKYGSSGAQAGAIALEIMRRAEDPNAFSVGMKQLETVVDVQDTTVRTVFELRDAREKRASDAAVARAEALQTEALAASTLQTVEELREDAAALAEEVAEAEEAQRVLVASLRTTASETAAMLERVRNRQATLQSELSQARAAEEAARREAERRAAAEAAARDAAARAAGGGSRGSASSASSSSPAGTGRLGTPGAGGGPAVPGVVCPVQGAVAGRDFSNDWGYPRSGGRYHQGNDIFANSGTPVVAVADATIVRWNPPSSPSGLGGITVTYRIGDGSEWYNAHLDSVADGIAPGVSVARGQIIGTVGNTGNARTTPPHLHLGRSSGGMWVNPWPTISPVCG